VVGEDNRKTQNFTHPNDITSAVEGFGQLYFTPTLGPAVLDYMEQTQPANQQ
jgi:hypothetical protein